jgi:hypothetical protein
MYIERLQVVKSVLKQCIWYKMHRGAKGKTELKIDVQS